MGGRREPRECQARISSTANGALSDGFQTLIVMVSYPTDSGYQPVGKQVLEPGGIFYTSVTGIW